MIDFDAAAIGYERPVLIAAAHRVRSGTISGRLRVMDFRRRTVEEVMVSDARYRLRHPIVLAFYPYVADGKGELVQELGASDLEAPPIAGVGTSFEEAYANWADQFHTHIQTLLSKRPWEMTDEERKNMATVERMIDVPMYNRESPYTYRQIGTVTRRRPIPDRVQWEDGVVESVSLHQMPAEFAAFQNGQRFEAITVRDSTTGQLQRVTYVGRLDPLSLPADDQWEKTPTFAAAPKVSWDAID